MTPTEISSTFSDEPLLLGAVQIDGESRDLILTCVSLGMIQRFSSEASSMALAQYEAEDNSQYLHRIFSECMRVAPTIIAVCCERSPLTIISPVEKAIREQFSARQLLDAMKLIAQRLDVDKILSHYNFTNKTSKSYPGSGSPWAMVINMAIASKGWSEFDLKWNISFANLIIYSQCIPSYSEDAGSSDKKEPVDMFSFFERD